MRQSVKRAQRAGGAQRERAGLGALMGLARSMSHAFEMGRARAANEWSKLGEWSGEERRFMRRREPEWGETDASLISAPEGAERRAIEDRRNDSNRLALSQGARALSRRWRAA